MLERERRQLIPLELLWLAVLGVLAVLRPVHEIHKQLILLGIGLFQVFEHPLLVRVAASRRRFYAVAMKILLATLLVAHTGGIDSSYYLIYFLPVIDAAMHFGALGTLAWTALALGAYASLLLPELPEYELTLAGANELAIRGSFFFLVAIVVNRFVAENRRQALRYQVLAETLAQTNRQLEQAQAEARRSERLAALGQMAAGLAHEIRNPLAVIKGSAETLARKLEGADSLAAELAGYISSEVNRLNGLVSRFLDFVRPSRIEARAEAIAPILERALKAAQDRWPDARITVERVYASDCPPVWADADLCEQVFTNLVINAYEAMLPQGGKLKVTVAAAHHPRAAAAGEADAVSTVQPDRSGVFVDIQDSGPGVPPELREQIFNPFFSTKREGVGLGLSIVSKIVDDHGGWIRVVDQPGPGACFRVFLPAADGARAPTSAARLILNGGASRKAETQPRATKPDL